MFATVISKTYGHQCLHPQKSIKQQTGSTKLKEDDDKLLFDRETCYNAELQGSLVLLQLPYKEGRYESEN